MTEVPREKRVQFNATEKEVVSGLSAGFIVTMTTHPLDVLKVRLQLDTTSRSQAESYKQISRSMRQAATVNGHLSYQKMVANLYRGISPNIIGNTLAWSLYFSLYRFYKDLTFKALNTERLDNRAIDSYLSSHHYLISAYAAGLTTSLMTNPIWVLKTRMLSTAKTHSGAYQSLADGIHRIFKEEGFKGFWKGLTPSLFGVLQSSIQFSIYDTLKQQFFAGQDLTLWQSIYLSAGSKTVSNVSLYPFQLVKSRLQSYGNTLTMTQAFAFTYQRHGIKGFYKGLIPNVLRVLPLTCITFGCYEQMKNWL